MDPFSRRFGAAGLRRSLRASSGPQHIQVWKGIAESNLKLNLDADLPGSIAIDVGISVWSDQSASANHHSQGTTGDQPSYTTLNGKRAVYFDGVTQFLSDTSFSGFTSGDAATIVVVGKKDAQPNDDCFFETADTAGTNDTAFELLSTGTQIYHRAVSTWPTRLEVASATSDTDLHVFTTLYSSSTSLEAFEDGASVGTDTSPSSTVGTIIESYVGKRPSGTSFCLGGYIQEILFWNTALTSDQLDTVHQRIGNKWGISVS